MLNQGGRTFITSGTGLFSRYHSCSPGSNRQNEAAQADLRASRADAQETQNEVALRVHQIYYQLLIAQLRAAQPRPKSGPIRTWRANVLSR